MKKISLAFSLLAVSIFLAFFSCTKINEATTLGGDLIPAVDNVHTFEVALDAQTKNLPFNDTSKLLFSDAIALGQFNDPDFGATSADAYFRISSSAYGTYPFIIKPAFAQFPDSLVIDSVVLSLSYAGAYGDTNSQQTVRVLDIAPSSDFNDTTLYTFTAAAPATVQELGSRSFTIKDLNDSVYYQRGRDTSKFVNVLRIKLNSNGEAFARRIAGFDTTRSSNGGFYSDSIFKSLVKGLAVVSDAHGSGQGGLAYFNLSDNANSRLTVYFQAVHNSIRDTSSFSFIHATNGQANIITRTPGGGYATYLANGASDRIYLQSTPGSYVAMKFPALDTFSNKVIHRAEIVATRINVNPLEAFTPPARLIVDRINRTHDTAFILEKDLVPSFDGSLSFDVFGGNLRSDDTYRFNITRHVQGIVTRHEPNDSLRLYAPLRTILFATNLGTQTSPKGSFVQVPILQRVGLGRVILGGGTYPDPNVKLRLRIIYSNL